MEEEQVNSKKKIILISSITIIALILVVGISYALWQQSKVQEGTNYIASGCFGVEFVGNNPINLANSFPITTEDGMKTTPYTFTITNTCNGKAAYDVNLESLSNTTFNNTSIRVALDSTHKLYSEYEEAETYYNDSIEARRLVSGRLEASESITYNLRLWIDEAVTIEEQNKIFASKIVVNASEDFDDPVIENINATSTINSINITYNVNGDISTTCKYGLTEGIYDNTVEDATTTDCNITGLADDTTYYYQVCTETGRGTKCETGNIKTLLDSPEPSIINLSATSTHNSIILTYQANGDVTPAVCKYGTSSGSYTNTVSGATGTRCNITGLQENKTYYYQVCTETKKGSKCEEGNIKTSIPFTTSDIGKYVTMTPWASSSSVTPSMTGYSSTQTINPNELNLWRVIKVNDDGTIEMVSEYVSSTLIYFSGKNGYMNLVGGLNTIASTYFDANRKHVQSARHMGYSNQIEKCTEWSNETCSDGTEYETDTDLVKSVIGSLKANKVGTSTAENYWLPSRGWSNRYDNLVDFVNTSGSVSSEYIYRVMSTGRNYDLQYAVRPIVTLKSTSEKMSGYGTKSSPYILN